MTPEIGIAGSNPAALPFQSRLRANGVAVTSLGSNLGADADMRESFGSLAVLMLLPRDILDCEELLFEKQGFARNAPKLEVIILSATLSPRYVQAMRGRVPAHIALIDAPFVGSARTVEIGQPSFLLGGEPTVIERMRPIFDILGHSNVVMGQFGTAMAAKALQDCLSAASSAMTRSAFEWAEAQGIDEAHLVKLLAATFPQRMPCTMPDPAALVANALPGDDAGAVLVRNVELALDRALEGVHLNPPRHFGQVLATVRNRTLH